eukprot:6469623-Amphidinium_carterae.1
MAPASAPAALDEDVASLPTPPYPMFEVGLHLPGVEGILPACAPELRGRSPRQPSTFLECLGTAEPATPRSDPRELHIGCVLRAAPTK